jgi:hypothetical protein
VLRPVPAMAAAPAARERPPTKVANANV